MRWEEVRIHYPNQWLLVEAVEAHSKVSNRILDEIAVVSILLLIPGKLCRAMLSFIIKLRGVSFMLFIQIVKYSTLLNADG